MKKIIPIGMLCMLLLSVFAAMPAAAEEKKDLSGTTINVFNWGQYIGVGEDDTINVNEEFTQETGIKVNYATYEDNETLYSKLKTGGSNYDIIIPSDYMVARLIDEGMLEKLDYQNIPNFSLVDDSLKNPDYDKTQAYSVPYTWGTVGIIYNTKYVKEKVDSWNALWNEEYKGKILMFNNPRDAFAIAQSLLGIDENTSNEDELAKAAEKLKEQKPILQEYVMDQVFDKMQNEEAWLAPYYAGDFITMNQENPDLAFAFPKEGFNVFVDAICIPKGAQNKEAAEAYINFLTRPDVSGRNCDAIGYSTPVPAAKAYVSEEFADSEIAYPGQEILSKGFSFTNLPSSALNKMDELWRGVKSGGNSSMIIYIVVAVVAVLIAAFFILRKVKRNKMY